MNHTFLMEFAKECCLSSSESGLYSMGSPVGSKSTIATNPSEFCAEDAPYYPITEVVRHQVVWWGLKQWMSVPSSGWSKGLEGAKASAPPKKTFWKISINHRVNNIQQHSIFLHLKNINKET